MKTILDRIEEKRIGIEDPSTWTDERRALRAEVRELREQVKAARDNAPLLLAMVQALLWEDKRPVDREALKTELRAKGLFPHGEIIWIH